jgi:hypothetical protein
MSDDTQQAAAAVEPTSEHAAVGQNDATAACVPEVQVSGDAEQQQHEQQQQQQHEQDQQYAYDHQQQQQYFEQQQQYQQQMLSSDPSASERIKLFVGNFPAHVTDLDLGAMCGQFAPIAGERNTTCDFQCVVVTASAEAVVLVDKATGLSKGSGFVFVNGKMAAESVIEGLHNKVGFVGLCFCATSPRVPIDAFILCRLLSPIHVLGCSIPSFTFHQPTSRFCTTTQLSPSPGDA